MSGKEIKKLLNDLISESDWKKPVKNLNKLALFDIPVVTIDENMVAVDLDEIIVFEGIELIVSKLQDEIRESCFLGQSDVSVTINVGREVCPQLFDYGIQKIFFYSPIENLEELPYLYEKQLNHLRFIFNVLQSPGISKGFFEKKGDEQNRVNALLFPFHREVEDDKSGLHYLVEKMEGSHFLRITVEQMEHSRLNLRRINHRVISNIEMVDDVLNIRSDASTIYSSMVSHCRDNKLTYKDSGLQLPELINYLKKARYEHLREITVNWPRTVANELLINAGKSWFGAISRLLLILSDSTICELLDSGKIIELSFSGTKAYLSLTQRNRNLQIDLQEKTKIPALEEYLKRMERLDSITSGFSHKLGNTHVIFIHHFTSETLAVLGAFDRMGAHTVDTLWVKYSGGIPAKYLETILSMPSSVYRFYGLQVLNDKDYKTRFCLSDRYSPIEHFSSLQKTLTNGDFEFYPAMQFIGMHLFLDAMTNKESTHKIIIAEDGGYLAPLVNQLALEGLTVEDVFRKYDYENDTLAPEDRNLSFSEWISTRFAGSVEHTRNGYDALIVVEEKFSKLAFPACSLAISNFKVHDESIEVAYSCLNAIENIMNGQGFVMNSRHALVLGSLGAIGIQTMKILSHRLGVEKLAGIDIAGGTKNYEWTQVNYPQMLPDKIKYSVDLIFGVVGKSILNIEFFEDLILHTEKRNIFLASGSTKRFEFIDFLDWTAGLLANHNLTLKGFPLKIDSAPIEDPQTSASLGTVISFEFATELRHKQVDFYLLSNLMPVNFQYYGVPTETMDSVMTEFVSLVSVISNAEKSTLPCKVLALDHAITLNGDLL